VPNASSLWSVALWEQRFQRMRTSRTAAAPSPTLECCCERKRVSRWYAAFATVIELSGYQVI